VSPDIPAALIGANGSAPMGASDIDVQIANIPI
jgi:hypothetical protein